MSEILYAGNGKRQPKKLLESDLVKVVEPADETEIIKAIQIYAHAYMMYGLLPLLLLLDEYEELEKYVECDCILKGMKSVDGFVSVPTKYGKSAVQYIEHWYLKNRDRDAFCSYISLVPDYLLQMFEYVEKRKQKIY